MAVACLPRTEGWAGREARRDVSSTDTIASASQMKAAMRELAKHGTTAQALTGKAMAEFGAVFAQGSASSSTETQTQALPPRQVAAPPTSVVCDDATLEPQPGFLGMHRASKSDTCRAHCRTPPSAPEAV